MGSGFRATAAAVTRHHEPENSVTATAPLAGASTHRSGRRRRRGKPAPVLIFHSAPGSHYASAAHGTELAAHGMMAASISGKGNCYDNSVSERFFTRLEFELVMRRDWHTLEEARRAISRYIETWYNRKCRHSTLGYVSPAAYEAQLLKAA